MWDLPKKLLEVDKVFNVSISAVSLMGIIYLSINNGFLVILSSAQGFRKRAVSPVVKWEDDCAFSSPAESRTHFPAKWKKNPSYKKFAVCSRLFSSAADSKLSICRHFMGETHLFACRETPNPELSRAHTERFEPVFFFFGPIFDLHDSL